MIAVAFVVAAATGATLRWLVATRSRWPAPWPTIVVNVAGSFALGLVADWDAPEVTVAAVAGLGSLTTFSTFVAELDDHRGGAVGVAASIGSLVVAVAAVALGRWLRGA